MVKDKEQPEIFEVKATKLFAKALVRANLPEMCKDRESKYEQSTLQQ